VNQQDNRFRRLGTALDYFFEKPELLRQALTHRSFGTPNNERLEFLGDAVLGLAVSSLLYDRFAGSDEGDLSRLRANLVRQDTLHQLAKSLELGQSLRLGEGELRSGGAERPSILADALEAILGAIYLDGGFEKAAGFIERLYSQEIAALKPGSPKKDPKTSLQEWLQGRKKALPQYELLETSGAAHEQRFTVACHIQNPTLRTVGQAWAAAFAEQAAAELALKALNP